MAFCDLADVELQQTSMFSSLVIEKVNIRTSTELYHLYGARIPVLKRADSEKEIGWPFSAADFSRSFFSEHFAVKNITVIYGNPPLLDGVELVVQPKERVCLVGATEAENPPL